jgi:hypothetical protein
MLNRHFVKGPYYLAYKGSNCFFLAIINFIFSLILIYLTL